MIHHFLSNQLWFYNYMQFESKLLEGFQSTGSTFFCTFKFTDTIETTAKYCQIELFHDISC